MDCRQALWVTVALLSGVAGCTEQQTLPLVSPPPMVEAKKENDLPKRTPKPATCVAYGSFREREANEPGRGSVERDQLRDQARKAYQQALEIDPKYLPASLALARLYTAMDDHERALATYQKAIKIHPKDPELWFSLGMCHNRSKEWEPALKCLRAATELDPENRQYMTTLGLTLARADRADESLAVLTKACGEAKAHYQLARMLVHMKQTEAGKQHLQLALQKDPQLAPAQQLLAQIDGKKPDGAKAVIQVGFEGKE